jgi:hypothetical protein
VKAGHNSVVLRLGFQNFIGQICNTVTPTIGCLCFSCSCADSVSVLFVDAFKNVSMLEVKGHGNGKVTLP